jgi:beta-glucosidase
MYIHQRVASVTHPVLELRGRSRITLKPGEQRPIDLPLTGDALSMLDVDMKRVVEPGIFEIILGTDSNRTTETLLHVEAASSPQ